MSFNTLFLLLSSIWERDASFHSVSGRANGGSSRFGAPKVRVATPSFRVGDQGGGDFTCSTPRLDPAAAGFGKLGGGGASRAGGAALIGARPFSAMDSVDASRFWGGGGLKGAPFVLSDDCWRPSLHGGVGTPALAAVDCEGGPLAFPKDGAGDVEAEPQPDLAAALFRRAP